MQTQIIRIKLIKVCTNYKKMDTYFNFGIYKQLIFK